MDMTDKSALDDLLAGVPEGLDEADLNIPASPARPRRNIPQLMRKIPVTPTPEVGSARVSLQESPSFDVLALARAEAPKLSKDRHPELWAALQVEEGWRGVKRIE